MPGYGPLLRRDGPSPATRSNTLIQTAASQGLLLETDLETAEVYDANGDRVTRSNVAHWLNGIHMQAYPPDPAGTFDPCGTGTDASKVEGGAIPLPEFGAVTVYLPETCTAWVVGPPPEFSGDQLVTFPDDNIRRTAAQVDSARRDPLLDNLNRAIENWWFTVRAVAALGGTEEAAVETVLCTGGAVPGNPHLTDTHLKVLNAVASGSGFTTKWTALDPVEALALLEEQIGATKKGGIIHAAPATVTYWARYRCIQEPTRQGDLYTLSGTPVVCGYGYINAVPDGSNFANLSATEDWAFATGPVKIWREPNITIYPGSYREALNRSTNDLTYRAERSYVVAWDTVLQVGVLIDRSINP